MNATFEKIFLGTLKAWRTYCAKKDYYHYKNLMKKSGIDTPSLTKEQKLEIQKVWGKNKYLSYDTHKLVYWATGKFDPYIVPEMIYRKQIEIQLNDQMGKYIWSDKNIFDLVLTKNNTPNTIVHNINGKLYDGNYDYLDEKEAISEINKYDEVFYKPANDSGMGRGICKLKGIDLNSLRSLGENYVIQEKLEIHPQLKQLNSTAVSIMRLITFYVDGKVYLTSASMRVGKEGAITDYTIDNAGKGALIIGITDNGVLKEFGYHPCGLTTKKSFNGFEFGGLEIPNYEEAVKLVEEAHRRLPYFGVIAWDVTIDKDEKPIIIEYNIKGAGCLYYQYTNGSLFGKFFDELYYKIF